MESKVSAGMDLIGQIVAQEFESLRQTHFQLSPGSSHLFLIQE